MTVATALAAAEARLAAAGVPAPALDAELLLRHALGWDRARVLSSLHDPLGVVPARAFDELVGARARRIPVQHLLGVQEFWRQEFRVTPDVLIPRPETELAVERALARLAGRAAPLVVDVGTGSGCIALSIAAERGDAVVHAIDLSPRALEVAAENARRLELSHRVTFHEGDLLAPLRALARPLDLVVSNPPYVTEAEAAGLEPEVRDFEPRAALVPPEGPLPLYARLIGEAAAILAPGAWIVMEVGAGQAAAVAQLARGRGLVEVQSHDDLAGIPRVVEARRAPSLFGEPTAR